AGCSPSARFRSSVLRTRLALVVRLLVLLVALVLSVVLVLFPRVGVGVLRRRSLPRQRRRHRHGEQDAQQQGKPFQLHTRSPFSRMCDHPQNVRRLELLLILKVWPWRWRFPSK